MSPRRVLLLVASLALTSACLCGGEPGSGKPGADTRQVAPFTRLDVAGAFRLRVRILSSRAGQPALVSISGDDNLVPLVRTDVSGRTLAVDTAKRVSPKLPLAIEIRVAALERLEVAGSADARVEGIAGDRFVLDCAGSADVVLIGTADELEVDIAGSADVDAEKLRVEDAEIDVAGSAEITVCATESLEVDVAGSGKVVSVCDPKKITQDIAGSGKVITRR